MPNLMVPPSKLNRTQTHSRSTSEFSSQKSEEHSEGRKIKVDLVVALKPQPIELKITFDIADGFGEAKSVAPILAIAIAKATTHFDRITNSTLSHMIKKDEKTNLVVEIGMEKWAPKILSTIVNPRIIVKLEEIESRKVV